MRKWAQSLVVALMCAWLQFPTKGFADPAGGFPLKWPIRQAGLVVTTLQDEAAVIEEPSPPPPPPTEDAGTAYAGDDEQKMLPEDPAYEQPPENPFVEESAGERAGTALAGDDDGDLTAEAQGDSACDPSCAACCSSSCERRCGTLHGRCRSCRGYGKRYIRCPGDPLPLFCCPWMNAMGLRYGGWIDHGVSVVANNPIDRYNGVVTFNDRDGEYQMNQLWNYLERDVDLDKVFDVGGRIDFVYGTDARFTQAADGLEANWNQSEPFYQVALPQFYLDASLYDWTFRIGHFYTVIGYEVVQAPENFFYSHAYTMQYGEPFTHTGWLLMKDIGPVSFTAGMHRGNDQFDDTDGLNAMNYLGSVGWTNADEDITAAFAVSASEDGPGVETLIYSLVGIFHLTDRLTWVMQHDFGQSTLPIAGGAARWYGINQYFFYEINCCLSAGMRLEWFRDADGTRVQGLGVGNLATGPFIGDFYELTFGFNWRPHGNITVRPEIRWDSFDQDGPGTVQPFDSGESNHQFLFGCDMIFTF